MANNIVTVGCESRCKILVELLDRKETSSSSADVQSTSSTPGKQDEKILPSSFYVRSKRGFITHTGTFNGVPVSIVMINMGYPNMDFLVREIRAVTEGALRIIRLGSCAGLRPDLPVGTVAVASEGSILIRQNPDAWGVEAPAGMRAEEPYLFHRVVPADEQLSRALIEELKAAPEEGEENSRRLAVVGCLNVSSDSFYSSQGEERGSCSMQSYTCTCMLLFTALVVITVCFLYKITKFKGEGHTDARRLHVMPPYSTVGRTSSFSIPILISKGTLSESYSSRVNFWKLHRVLLVCASLPLDEKVNVMVNVTLEVYELVRLFVHLTGCLDPMMAEHQAPPSCSSLGVRISETKRRTHGYDHDHHHELLSEAIVRRLRHCHINIQSKCVRKILF